MRGACGPFPFTSSPSNVLRQAVHIGLWLVPIWCQAQAVLSGSVLDADAGSALPYASVSVPELHIGTRTDSAGAFTLRIPHPGTFTVQVTLLGRESHFEEIAVAGQPIVLTVKLRPSQMELRQVDVVGTQVNAPRNNPRQVDAMSADEMRERGALSVSDAVAKLPGVTQLTTGVGISKPVIRGLYGNRVQVNALGQRFDNQQWQDEHGLGLSAVGIDRVEVIKGPAALLYGSDAIGGVINVIEEKPAPVGTTEQNAQLGLMSNTGGGSLSYGVKKSTEKLWWRLAAGADSHGDYASGGDVRVLNSRFAMYNAKGSLGWRKGRWTSANHVHVSFSQFGFVFDTAARSTDDARLSRSFAGPHHQVLFAVFGSENTLYGERTKWRINLGWTSNQRQEQEGGNKISLDMLLNTGSLVAQATTRMGEHGSWTNGISLLYQTNTNLGSRIIVPDATTLEGSAYSYYRHRLNKAVIEGGLRVDDRAISTLATLNLNPPGAEVEPFDKSWTAVNGSLGLAWDPSEPLNVKANVSSGYRSGNLAELSSNGLHEGTARFEIGDPSLRVERNICAELGFTWEWKEQLEVSVAGYRNQFFDYIYLAPTGTEYIGFQVYRFRQADAVLQGGEFVLDLHPKALRKIDARIAYNLVRAEKGDGSPLPFIPADRLMAEVRFMPSERFWIRPGAVNVMAQDRPDDFETATPGYTLFNVQAGAELKWNKHPLKVSIFCNNLLDERYVDHLSRFKYFRLNDVGRNVGLSLQLTF
jgi:iron complex outermembrane receptor protein